MNLNKSAEPVYVYNLPTARMLGLAGSLAEIALYGKSPVHKFLLFYGGKGNVIMYIFQINIQYLFKILLWVLFEFS